LAVTSRGDTVRRAIELSVLSIVLSGISGGIAVAVALSTGSLSLLGFGFDAAIDSVASAVLVWRFLTESREPHRAERVERLAEGAVGAVLMLLAAYLAFGAVRSLVSGTQPLSSSVAAVLLVASLVVLPPIALAKHRVAQQLGSGALRADSVLTGVAALLAAISLGSLLLNQLFSAGWADSVAALIVATIVVREGWSSVVSSRSSPTG
jgi:divalent metal cation (Fe/Co/Zn/Cd) transporter